jgi:hypothetical protein
MGMASHLQVIIADFLLLLFASSSFSPPSFLSYITEYIVITYLFKIIVTSLNTVTTNLEINMASVNDQNIKSHLVPE